MPTRPARCTPRRCACCRPQRSNDQAPGWREEGERVRAPSFHTSPMPATSPPSTVRTRLGPIATLLRPQWKTLLVAFLAVLVETAADVLEPWPIKVVVDNVLQSKKLPPGMAAMVLRTFGDNTYAILYFALAAIMLIAI